MVKVVLVEDDAMLAEIYQTRLKLAGHDCLVANDGQSGFELIQKELPELVLLDLMLPNLSGDDILRKMRNTEWGKKIKAIFLTNISESEAPEDIKHLDFEGYIVKAELSNNQLETFVARTLQPKTTEV